MLYITRITLSHNKLKGEIIVQVIRGLSNSKYNYIPIPVCMLNSSQRKEEKQVGHGVENFRSLVFL
jgi:hypothetical protein